MNRTNYHSHCHLCDGRTAFELFVEEAIKQNFKAYGLSSHAPLPFSTSWTLKKENVQKYFSQFERIKQKYSEQIELYIGMEIDYLDAQNNPASAYFQQMPLDYRIGSVHLLSGTSGEVVDIDTSPEQFRQNLQLHLGGNIHRVVSDYFEKAMLMIQAGGFDFLGHADKIYYNALSVTPDLLQSSWYKKLMNDYYAYIAEKELPIEINTKAYEKTGCFFPHIDFWKQIKERKIPVMVNSDAHFPERINSGRKEALDLMKEVGFTELWILKGQKWQSESLNLE